MGCGDSGWLVRTRHEDGVVRISLHRDPVNALCPAFLMDFAELLDGVEKDCDVRAVVIDSPFKVFSAGLDLKEAQTYDLKAQHAIVEGLNVAFTKLFAFPKPTVAAVRGAAIAGGLFFVLASDYRVAGPQARFGLAEVRVGADFPVGPLEIARETLGPNDLRRLMLTGQPISADAALSAGIVDLLVENDDLLSRALSSAGKLADNPPQTYAAVKRQIRGNAIERIETAMAESANSPANGWFSDETRAAMQKMIG